MNVLVSQPVNKPLNGTVQVPGDKSISHRAAIFATLANGLTTITGWLQAEDTLATLAACEAMGAGVIWRDQNHPNAQLQITGCAGQMTAVDRCDLGNSGTGARLLLGLLAGQSMKTTVTGDTSLRSRPMGRIIKPLRRMGAHFASFTAGDNMTLPITCQPSAGLKGIDYTMPVASAQLQAALLLAGMQAEGTTTIRQPGTFRDHSERMLAHFGADIKRIDVQTLQIRRSQLAASPLQVPADFSSAAFLLAAAILVPGSMVELPDIGVNSTRTGLLHLLDQMQAPVQIKNETVSAEPVATLHAGHRPLTAIDVPNELVANSIDEFPVLMALAACADGITRIRGAAELRVKESDRIAVMCKALQQLGITVQEYKDGADVTGVNRASGACISGGEVSAMGDHRIAMSLAVLGLVAQEPVIIHGARAINTSYPDFTAHMNTLGAKLEWRRG